MYAEKELYEISRRHEFDKFEKGELRHAYAYNSKISTCTCVKQKKTNMNNNTVVVWQKEI